MESAVGIRRPEFEVPDLTGDRRPPPAIPDPLAEKMKGDCRAVNAEVLGEMINGRPIQVPLDQHRHPLVRQPANYAARPRGLRALRLAVSTQALKEICPACLIGVASQQLHSSDT
jgi:hypothetical protein